MLSKAKTTLAAVAIAASFGISAQAAEVTGAGASFVYPAMSKWSSDYNKATKNKVNYQSIGSAGGIAQIKAGTVDFGSSDAPMKPADLQAAGLAQFPSVMGAVVPVINVPGVAAGSVKFTGPVLAEIFMGNVTKWNDASIAAINPGVALPDVKITVVHRSDGSGTTFNFVNYLSKVNLDWRSKVGEGTSVKWPVGIGGKGNEGVAAYTKQIKGAIGYVELSYAITNKLNYAPVRNRAGNFVVASKDSIKAAAAAAEWNDVKDFSLVITDAPGANSYPISATNFIIMYKNSKNAQRSKDTLAFFDWVYANGDVTAENLGYVALPAELTKSIKAYWAASIK